MIEQRRLPVLLLYSHRLAETQVPGILQDTLRAAQFAPKGIVIEEGRSEVSGDLEVEIQRHSVVVVVLPGTIPPQWLSAACKAGLFSSSWVAVLAKDGGEGTLTLTEEDGCFARVLAYDPSRLTELAIATIKFLSECREELLRKPLKYTPLSLETRESVEPYDMLYVKKKVVISPSGHGYIETRQRIQTTNEGFEGTAHYFGLNEYTPSEVQLPSLEDLMAQPPEARFYGSSFAYKLVHPEREDLAMAVIPVPEESTGRTRIFRFLFTPSIARGTILDFVWSWSHPDIFNPRGKDASTFKCLRDYGELHLDLIFEHYEDSPIFTPYGVPHLVVYNSLGLLMAIISGKRIPQLHGVQYSWSMYDVPAHTTLVVEWERT